MGVKRRHARVETFGEHVIDQQADADPTIRGIQERFYEQVSDRIVFDQVVLGIDRSFRPVGHQQAQRQCVDTVVDHVKTGVTGRGVAAQVTHVATDIRVGRFRRGERPGLAPRVVEIDACAAGDDRRCQYDGKSDFHWSVGSLASSNIDNSPLRNMSYSRIHSLNRHTQIFLAIISINLKSRKISIKSGESMPTRIPRTPFCTAILILLAWTGSAHAETSTISAIIPWQGQGQIFPVGVGTLRFLGSLEGIMYVETAEGAMNEAFVRCPIVQSIDAADQSTSASGNCVIAVSPEDTVFAELACEGIAGFCNGEFTLTGGTGRFAGVSGSGRMTVRSPVHALAADLSDGTVIHAAAGILQIPELKVSLP